MPNTNLILLMIIPLIVITSHQTVFSHDLFQKLKEIDPYNLADLKQIETHLLSSEQITLDKFLGNGGYGFVMKAGKTFEGIEIPLAVKFMRANSKEQCVELEVVDMIANAGAEYLLQTFFIKYFLFGFGNQARHYCAIGCELGLTDLYKFRLEKTPNTKEQHETEEQLEAEEKPEIDNQTVIKSSNQKSQLS